jgi:hypothetical protein
MITANEYRQFSRQCMKWAVETDKNEDRKAFLDLARDWSHAAIAADAAAAPMERIRTVPSSLTDGARDNPPAPSTSRTPLSPLLPRPGAFPFPRTTIRKNNLQRSIAQPRFFCMATDARIIAGRQLYVATQRAKIHIQREFVCLLESRGSDAELVMLEKQVLNRMKMALNKTLSKGGVTVKRAV